MQGQGEHRLDVILLARLGSKPDALPRPISAAPRSQVAGGGGEGRDAARTVTGAELARGCDVGEIEGGPGVGHTGQAHGAS